MESVVTDVLRHTRTTELELQPAELNSIVASALEMIHPRAEEHGVDLLYDETPLDKGQFDSGQVYNVILNLVKNAIEACEDGQGSVNVSTSQDKKGFYIKVADTGVRIPAEDIPKLSQPFHVERSERDGARARIQLQSGRGTPRVGSRGEHTRSGVRVHGLLSPRGGRGDAPPSSKKTPSGSCCPTSARLPQRPTPIYTSAISSRLGPSDRIFTGTSISLSISLT